MNAAQQYDNVRVVEFNDAGHPWRIFDKPNEGRLMITPSLERSAGIGMVRGLTFGIGKADIPKPEYQHAVEGWLRRTERTCHVTDGYVLWDIQWEFKYTCETP